MIGCIAVNRSGIASSLTTAELEAELGIPVLGIVPQAGDPLASAYRQKQLLVFAQPGHGAAEGISTITKALLNL
jgi:glutamate racemase